ncbi:putative bifunctional diguanylate cyclase/phosphodiesterase [Paracoccus shandongensis]|uniref:putative bifunctional diguanylate cyclase/phosphodiesterase n=1 Tax=Paracoccus shandongensis TaxID=2816048 RepID=UPI001A8D072F|nr:EAL domain-containing protein [Paracoccus shandongensis]
MTSQSRSHHLPRQILFFMLIGVIIFAGSGLYTFQQIASRLDAGAASNSQARVTEGLASLQTHVRLFSKDYNNWTDVYAAAWRGDIAFIANNYGITANQGEIFELALMFGGPFKRPISWIENGSRSPGGLIFSAETVASAVLALEAQDQTRPSVDFFAVEGGRAVIVTASYLLPDPDQVVTRETVRASAVTMIGRHLSGRDLAIIEQDAGISDLQITTSPKPGYLSIPLPDVTSSNSLYLSWKAAQPGSALVGQLAPVIAIVSTAFVALAALATWLVCKNARQLILREVEARELARTDALTGLPNRLSFNEAVQHELTNIASEFALVMIDIDRLKQTNDVFGHAVGDCILRNFSENLQLCADPGTFIARLGGDEFCAIVRGSGAAERAQAFLAVLEVRCSKPVKVQGENVHLSFSAGIATHALGEHVEETLRKADLALLRGKSALEERVGVYDINMDLADKSTLLLEQALRGALRNPDEFRVVYQSIMPANGEEVLRVEALARWTNPILGSVGPDQFIRVAEQTGLISELGWIIIDKVLTDLATTQEVCASINVSPLQLMKPDFVSDLLLRLEQAGIATARIQIELTENVMIRNQQAILDRIREIRSVGIKVALDDFGTGFSAISYLTATDFDSIKIDGSLLRSASESQSRKDFFNSVVSLSRAVCGNVVVEGIETSEQAQMAESSGADAFQGYLYGLPAAFNITCGPQLLPNMINKAATKEVTEGFNERLQRETRFQETATVFNLHSLSYPRATSSC